MNTNEMFRNLKKHVLLRSLDILAVLQKLSSTKGSFRVRVLPLALVFFLECLWFPLNAQAFRLGDRATMQRQLESVSESPLVQRTLYPFLLDYAESEVDPQIKDEVVVLLDIFKRALLSCLSDLESEGRFEELDPLPRERVRQGWVYLTKRDRASLWLSSRLLPDLIRAVVPQNPRLAEAVIDQIFRNQFLGFFTIRLSVAEALQFIYRDHAEFRRILDLWRE